MKIVSSGKLTCAVASIIGVTNTTGAAVSVEVYSPFVPGTRVRISGVAGSTLLNGVWWIKSVTGSESFRLTLSAQRQGAALTGDGSEYTGDGSISEVVRLSPDASLAASVIRAQVIAGETGRKFIGTSRLDTTSPNRRGVLKEFWPNATGGIGDSWTVADRNGGNSIHPNDLFLDVWTPDEALLVTIWQS